jgi:HD superfamily phosphohydrolase
MSSSWPKFFRDPIHDLIVFHDTRPDRLVLDLINTREVQRLRRIKQLGFSELVFPGANHSRFAHSLGVLHVTKKFLDQFALASGRQLEEYQRCLVLAAALLHDIGHGPFSHAFEKTTGIQHEALTREIITESSTQVHQRLRAYSANLPEQLAWFFDEDADVTAPPAGLPLYLTQVVSSQFDADRCDYLLRDSKATGTNYGEYDLEWLLSHVQPQPDGRRFYLSRKALSAAEAYVFARFHMYRMVYFHKTTRAAEVMLGLLFRRVRELLAGNASLDAAQKIVPDAPRSVLACFAGQPSIFWYTRIDEHAITEFLKACSDADDPVLKDLGGGIAHRELFKVIDATGVSPALVGDFTAAVRSRLQNEKDSEYLFAHDSPADMPYKPYDPDADKPAEQIFVEDAAGRPRELSTLSQTVEELRRQYELLRYYFPERLRREIEATAGQTLRKG